MKECERKPNLCITGFIEWIRECYAITQCIGVVGEKATDSRDEKWTKLIRLYLIRKLVGMVECFADVSSVT